MACSANCLRDSRQPSQDKWVFINQHMVAVLGVAGIPSKLSVTTEVAETSPSSGPTLVRH